MLQKLFESSCDDSIMLMSPVLCLLDRGIASAQEVLREYFELGSAV